MSEMQSKKIDIANKCSTMCVCRIVLQIFFIKIQKSNYNVDISNVSVLIFDGMCFSLENDVDDTVPKEPTIGYFSKQSAGKNSANVLTLC